MNSLRDINMRLKESDSSQSQNESAHSEKRNSRPAPSKIKVQFIPSEGEPFPVLLHTKPSVGDTFILDNSCHKVVAVERMLYHPENSMVREGRIHVYTYIKKTETTS